MKERITYSEFLGWLEFLQLEKEFHTKNDYYLAQIACEIRRSSVTTPKKVKIDHFLLKFATKGYVDPEEQMKKSKQIWGAALGLKIENN